jgi:hypothetical protein
MKKILLSITILSTGFFALSQKLAKYEEKLPSILSAPSSGINASLQPYIADDPENASIYFQLGVVYYSRYLDSDILTDFQYKYGNARKALENMKISKLRVDEKDVKKNDEHYLNFGSYDAKGRLQVTYDTIQSLIDASIVDTERFIAGAPAVYQSFTESFTHYDRAHKLYTALLGSYPTINELYLLYDDEMEKSFKEISSEYEKAIAAFESYKAATDTFDIGYNQEMIIEELEVYRLDGMSAEINFLQPKIPIWNYAKWVTETREYIEANIVTMREELMTEELRVNGILSSAAGDYARDAFEPLDINKETLFTIRKFDLQSVIEPIFLFKEAKHDLIYRDLQIKDLELSADVDTDRKLFLYGELINKIRKADTMLLDIRTRNTQLTHEKYPTFLSVNYEGRTGINSFARAQSDELVTMQTGYEDKIIEGVVNKIRDSSEVSSATYRRLSIPLNTIQSPPTEILTDIPVTTHRLKNFDGSSFIGGVKKNADSVVVSYVAGITPEGKVGWYNEYELKLDSGQVNADARLAVLAAVPGGSAFVINVSSPEFPTVENRFIILDEAGEERLNISLEISDYPVNITYNDRNNSLLMSFTGKDYLSDVYEAGRLTLARYNFLGDQLWQQEISGRIEVSGVTATAEGFLMVGNFAQYRSPDGRMIRAGRNNTDVGVFLLAINNTGQILRMEDVYAIDPIYATHLVKVSEDCINILGSKGRYDADKMLDLSDTGIFIMINRDFAELARRE